MVGSAHKLLDECRELAALIGLPDNMDPESEDLWEAAEAGAQPGPPWKAYGVEAFSLARLIRGCERALQLGAVLQFG